MSRTALRLAPAAKIATHAQFSAHLRGERVYPVNLEISPSDICNADCSFCFYSEANLGGHKLAFLDADRATELLGECADLGVRSVSWSGGGEPTLHPRFGELSFLASVARLRQGLFTNALAAPHYDPALFDWIRVTVTDRPLRPDVLRQLRACPTLGLAFNYAGPADDSALRSALAVAESAGADYVQVRPALPVRGATADIAPPALEHPLLHPTPYKFADAGRKHGYATCEGFRFVPFVWADGEVNVCAYHRGREGYALGNLHEKGLKDILDAAPASVPVRDDCQTCCRLNELNKAVHAARELVDADFP